MLKKIVLPVVLLLAYTTLAGAANYIPPPDLKLLMEQKKEVIIVDIQPAQEFEQHFLQGSIETNAFPAKNDDEKIRLEKVLPVVSTSTAPVVIVCPRGGSGAKNSYDYLQSRGISEDRLLILKGGIAGWPYPDLVQHSR